MKNIWKLLFVPHEKNNHRAMLLKPTFLCLLMAFFLFSKSLIKSFTVLRPGVLGYSSEITDSQVFALTNIERQKLNLPPLHYNSTLSKSATLKGQDMFAHNYWAHNSPQGKTPWDFFKSVDYNYSVAGENLAKDFDNNDSLMKAWMNSPSHRSNIISDKYQEIGIGVVQGILDGVKTTIVVQHFASPADSEIADNTSSETEFNSHPYGLAYSNSNVLAQSVNSSLFSPLLLTKIISISIFLLLIGTLFIDGYITLKNKTKRLNGSTVAHISFLVVILLFVVFTQQGVIF